METQSEDEGQDSAVTHSISSVLEHLVREMRVMRSSQQIMRREGRIVGSSTWSHTEQPNESMPDSLRRSLLFATSLSDTMPIRRSIGGFSLIQRNTRRVLPPIIVPWPLSTQSDDDDDDDV